MTDHQVVSHQQWQAARDELLQREKEHRALPPIVAVNAAATGTDVIGYLSQTPTMSAFTLQDGAVYQTYTTAARGVEFMMPYYPILDRAAKGRDEGDAFQTWIRRHDEYA